MQKLSYLFENLFQSIKDDKTMNGALRILFFKSYPNVHNTLHEKKKLVKKNIFLFVCLLLFCDNSTWCVLASDKRAALRCSNSESLGENKNFSVSEMKNNF